MLSPKKKTDVGRWFARTQRHAFHFYQTIHRTWAASLPQRLGIAVGLTVCSLFLLFASHSVTLPSLRSSAKSAPGISAFRTMASEMPTQSKTDLSIMTVVSRTKMASLREFVGSVHLYCPKCHVIVFGFDLSSEQIAEIRNWDRVNLNDVHRDLLSSMSLGYDRSFNIVQSAIVSALKSVDRILYLSVDYSVSNSLDSVDALLREKGHVFVAPDDNLEGADASTKRVVKHIQGYSKASQAYTDVALKLHEYPCAPLPTAPCMIGSRIDLPRASSHQYSVVRLSHLPITAQRLEDQTMVLSVRSEANVNTDPDDISFTSKAFHTELETFANSNFAYIRFDLSGVYGNVHSAQLALHPAWLHDPARPSEASTGQADICLVESSTWDERGVRWSERPSCTDDVVSLSVDGGSAALCDVTSFVQSVVSGKLAASSQQRLSLMIRSKSDMWIKYHSRFSPRTDFHPKLRVTVSGQGANHLHIRSVSSMTEGSNSLVEIEDNQFA